MNQRAGITGLIVAFIFACAAWPATAAPRAPPPDDAKSVDKVEAMIAANAEQALAQQGGSRLLFKVDADALREAMVTDLRDDVVRILREGRIPFADLAMHQGSVEVRIADAKNRQRLLGRLAPSGEAPRPPTIDVADGGDGLIRLTPREQAFAERLHQLVRQSTEMIDQRLRNSGIMQPGVEPDGADRIRVVLPGVRDPESVAAMFSKKARLAFRLVDVSMTAEEALKGAAPPASEVLYDFKTKVALSGSERHRRRGRRYHRRCSRVRLLGVTSRSRSSGSTRMAQGASPTSPGTMWGGHSPSFSTIAYCRCPSSGSRIGRGSGQISGNFTLEQANTVAMLLRSGTLPGRLSVVDQQIVEPAGNAARP